MKSVRSQWVGIAWLVVAAGLVFLAVAVREERALTALSSTGLQLAVVGIVSAVATWLLAVATDRTRSTSLVSRLFRHSFFAAVCGYPLVAYVVVLRLEPSRITLGLLLAILITIVFVALVRLPNWLKWSGLAVAYAVALVAYLPIAKTPSVQTAGEDGRFVATSYHDLKITTLPTPTAKTAAGGAVQLIAEGRMVLIDALGQAIVYTISDDGLSLDGEFEFNVPMERQRYLDNDGPRAQRYRVTDAMILDAGPLGLTVLATHSFWNPDGDCFTLRLSSADWNGRSDIQADQWQLRYETLPCIQLPTYTNEQGGRMALLDDRSLLVSIGNHNVDTFDASILRTSHYGDILSVDLETWDVERFSTGHRNVQGLFVAPSGIWASEHGPAGGDELNRVQPGQDYGWPYASYGTDYSGKTLMHGRLGDHEGYARPIYAWTPSPGLSSLIEVQASEFEFWAGDLLIGSLWGKSHGKSLFRARIRDDRLVSSERINIDSHVRDLIELDDGRLVVWNGTDALHLIESASHVFGECMACHSTREYIHGIGPSLSGVLGAPVASQRGFEYSNALLEFGGRWTDDRLDEFLANPSATVPGTTMAHGGVADPVKRREIIDYLRQTAD